MSTLKERFYKEIRFMERAEICEKIAEDFAISFGQWVSDNDWVYLPSKNYWVNEEQEELEQKLSSKQLLKTFKKERSFEI